VTELTPAARRLLARAKAGQLRPDAGARARVLAGVSASIAVSTSGAPAEVLRRRAGTAANGGTTRLGLVPVVGSLVTVAAIAGVMAWHSAGSSPAARSPVRAAHELAAPVSAPVPLATVHSDEPAPARAAIAAQEPAPAQDLRAEMAVLRRVEAALRAGDPARALRETRVHGARFPQGALREEREGLQLIALCTLGRDVSKPLALYLALEAHSVLSARVRDACKAAPQ
jgi:hypothetical protein